MTVVQYEAPPPLPASRPGDELLPGPTGRVARLRSAAEYANYVANTAVVPEALRGKPDEVAAVILTGEEVGLEPMAALRSVAMIKGTPAFKAEALRGLVINRGHELWFEESTSTRAIAAGRRGGSDRVGRVTWTMDDAKRAGIAGQTNYRNYPAEMLRARASAALARSMFADVVMGLIAAEELEDFEYAPNGAPETPPPAPPPDAGGPPTARTRRRRPAASPAGSTTTPPVAPTPPPDQQPEPEIPPDPPATDAYKKKIFALMRDVGIPAADRAGRLAYASRIADRELASSNDLTIGEAGHVIEDLERILALPADQRAAAIAGASDQELQTVAELEALTEGGDAAPAEPDEPPGDPPPAYNEFPPGY